MSKQTPIEWLESRISILIPEDIGSQLMFKSNIKKAKEMEREQIEDAYVECYMNHVGNGESILREANSYYKNTYGGQDEK